MVCESLIPYLNFVNSMAREGKNRVHIRRVGTLQSERSGVGRSAVPQVREDAEAADVPVLERAGDAADLL
jgi:hypothetical protein